MCLFAYIYIYVSVCIYIYIYIAAGGEGVWCRWNRGLASGDWALALDVVLEMPRWAVPRLVRHLRALGRRGVVVSWLGGERRAAARELLHGLRAAGFARDRAATAALQGFGGLLCCPSRRHALVLRRAPPAAPQRPCELRVLQELPGSLPCAAGQSFGCVEGGIWVHLGCAARFRIGRPPAASELECRSERNDYAECAAETAAAATTGRAARAAGAPGAPRRLVAARPRFAARWVERSDLSLRAPPDATAPADRLARHNGTSAVAPSAFWQLFALPLGFLYDALDPLTSAEGEVWRGDGRSRLLTMAALHTFKLALARGPQLAVEARHWSRAVWPRLRADLAEREGGPSDLAALDQGRLALLVSSLRAASEHAQPWPRPEETPGP